MRAYVKTLVGLATIAALGCSPSVVSANDTCVAPSAAKPIADPAELRTVVVSDREVLKNFPLSRTLAAIITSAGGQDSPGAEIALLETMISSFQDKSETNPISRIDSPLTPRPGEAKLDASALLSAGPDEMRPVGLFNRLDLAPADWKYCGEYRIVYEKGDPVSPTNRLTMIFEAALDNPAPALGAQGCRPVAAFWDGLKTKSIEDLSNELQDFYYKGLNGQFKPVVHYLQYGLPFGQVRANLFVNDQPPKFLWQLREWHTRPNNGTVAFVPDTVKGSPLPALYQSPAANEDPRLTVLRTAFWNDFVGKYVEEITQPDLAALSVGRPITEDDLLFHMGMPVDDKYDGFESTGNSSRDDPNLAPDAATLLAEISAKLDSLKLSSGCSITPKEVLARAGAQSCGGCHNFSVGQPVAVTPSGPANWPAAAPNSFVQIDEDGNLSPLLTDFFLPRRRQNLSDFLAQTPAIVTTSLNINQVESFRALATSPKLESIQTGNLTPPEEIVAGQRSALREIDRQTPGAFIQFRPSD